LGGGVDYLLKIMTRDIDAYQRLVDSLLEQEIGIARYFTYIVTRSVKEEDALPLAELLPAAES
jgi:Lrp/AsnC family transcriptional regulator of ectoine degradation